MKGFRTFDLAVAFYRQSRTLELPGYLKDQLVRAASSAALNLAEGRGKHTLREQLRYFHIALGSVRESQAALILADLEDTAIWQTLDHLAASLHRLIEKAR